MQPRVNEKEELVKEMFCKGIVIGCVLALLGCTSRIGTFTMLSDSNLDFEHCIYEVDKSHRVHGSDQSFIFTIIPFGLPDVETAVATATRTIPDCAGLANASVKSNWFWLGLGYYKLEVIGYPIVKTGGMQ